VQFGRDSAPADRTTTEIYPQKGNPPHVARFMTGKRMLIRMIGHTCQRQGRKEKRNPSAPRWRFCRRAVVVSPGGWI